MVQLSHPYITTGKTIALIRWTFVGKVMSLLFNMLSRYTGDMDFAIVIRTMILGGGRLVMRAGAGIVADSDPAKEYDETVNKSKAIFAAAQFAASI